MRLDVSRGVGRIGWALLAVFEIAMVAFILSSWNDLPSGVWARAEQLLGMAAWMVLVPLGVFVAWRVVRWIARGFIVEG